MKYVGTGHADTTKWEWAVNQHRDSYASYIGHHSLLAYSAVAENESIGRLKYQYLQARPPTPIPPPPPTPVRETRERAACTRSAHGCCYRRTDSAPRLTEDVVAMWQTTQEGR